MHRALKLLGAILLPVIVLATAWASLALWYRLSAPELVRGFAGLFFALIGLGAIAAVITRSRYPGLLIFFIGFGAVQVWWATIKPADQLDWAPDVARQVTGTVDGQRLTLTNVRDFEWRSNSDFSERWTSRTYDLAKLKTLDLFMSHWSGPEIAHLILSFGFAGGDYLAWSIEVRRRVDGEFSPVADLFKSNSLVIIAADERDIVKVRSNVRGEDVQLYRLRTSPEVARLILLEYVEDANRLSARPVFYNSLITNCTTTVVKLARSVGVAIPFDWRLVINGFLPALAYEKGAVDTRVTLAELKRLAQIGKRANDASSSLNFSDLIRLGVPTPRE